MAARGRDLGEGVVTAVALATYDPALTGALPGPGVAGSRLGADGEAVTRVAGVLTRGAVVVVLEADSERERERERETWQLVKTFTSTVAKENA